jgi:hypothetical protein
LYTILLAVGYKLGIDYRLWTFALGAVTLAIAGILGARLAERLMPKQRLIGLVGGLSLVLAWHLIWSAASGMETMLFCMFTLLLIWLTWAELDTAHVVGLRTTTLRGACFGVSAALATLARPEGLVLAILVGIVMLFVRPHKSWGIFASWVVSAAIGLGVFIAPYLVYNLQLTGGLLPDTAAAKQAEHALLLTLSYPARLINMSFPLIGGGQFMLIPGIAYFAFVILQRIRKKDQQAVYFLLLILWPVVLIGLYAARLPAPYQHGRYVIPSLPCLVLAGVIGTLWIAQQGRGTLIGRVVSRSLMISTLLAYLYFAFIAGTTAYRQDVRIINEEMVASAHWIAANLPPDELLAVHDIGAVGYFAPRPILDLAGLVSPEVVSIILDEEALWTLLQARGARYLMAFPDQVPGKNIDDSRLCQIFTTNGAASRAVDGPNMTIYALSWDGVCT